jgi:hypothetical protein
MDDIQTQHTVGIVHGDRPMGAAAAWMRVASFDKPRRSESLSRPLGFRASQSTTSSKMNGSVDWTGLADDGQL